MASEAPTVLAKNFLKASIKIFAEAPMGLGFLGKTSDFSDGPRPFLGQKLQFSRESFVLMKHCHTSGLLYARLCALKASRIIRQLCRVFKFELIRELIEFQRLDTHHAFAQRRLDFKNRKGFCRFLSEISAVDEADMARLI